MMNADLKHLGKYELQERLGRGGMAEVWKAFDPQLKRYVAIKFLLANLRFDSDFVKRFVREAQAVASLHHPNIVQVYDFYASSEGSDNSMAYMVMDYIEGQTLANYIRDTSRAGKFPSPAELVNLFTSIGLALDYAHEHKLIHRDIKPANILLDKRNTSRNPMGEPVLSDFGIVKLMGTSTSTLTVTGTSLGTPLYISPEQAKGYQGNESSDIYSLGVILYEMCTGVPPFQGDTAYAILIQHVTGNPPPPSLINPNIPQALDSVILRCLAKDPAARFPKASSMTAALAEALNVPAPELISYPTYSRDQADQPTFFNAPNPGRLSGSAPQISMPSNSENIPSSPGTSPGGSSVGDNETVLMASSNNSPASPGVGSTLRPSAAMQQPVSSPPLPGTFFPQQASKLPPAWSQGKGLRNGVIVVLLLILLGSGLAVYPLLTGSASSGGNTSFVGHASFTSSRRQLNNQGLQSINDGIQISLRNIPNPAPGNSYYAWLENSNVETTSILLGKLSLNQGVASLSYTDSQNRNLLSFVSNFLITEQPTNPAPISPALDKGKWRYFAAFPQTLGRDRLSYLDHLHHLLSGEPGLDTLGLPGGVDTWFLHNMEQMQKEAMEVHDHADIPGIRQQITNVLYYLDGKCAPQDLSNVPAGAPTQPQNATIAHDTQLPLLDCAQTTDPPGHLTHIGLHLAGLVHEPGVTANQVKLAIQINASLNITRARLENVRKDAIQLAAMNDTQLTQAQGDLRNDLALWASRALEGGVSPATQEVEPSVRQICDNIELLAIFDVAPYHP